ncbi:MAG: sodium:solute symporter family protein [Lentisphaeria bacterium]|nr:sodium:solute symporter family protein [Lentisphaeria bacterium]
MEAQTVSLMGSAPGSLPDKFQIWLWICMVIYIAVLLGLGWFSSKKIKGMNDFLVAGRRLPLWMATATLLATWFGAGSSMGVAATVYSDGIGGVLADPFGASLSLILAGVFIVGMLRRLKCLTVTDIIERRYGKWAGIYASAWMVPVYIGWLGAQVLGMGTIIHVLTGMSVTNGTLIAAGIVLVYTVAGGMWAVTLTDIVQVSLIIIGLFLIIPGAVSEAGGWNTLLQAIPKEHLSIAKTADTSWTYYIGSWIIMGFGCMIGQDLVQRSLSSRNDKIAASSSVIAGFFYLAVAVVPITIGFAARLVLAKYNITAETMGGDLDNQVLPRMALIILGQLSPVILILFLCALISAILSSADSSLLAGASLLTNNVIRPLCPRMSDKALLMWTRIATIGITIIGTYLALNVKSIYSLMINSWASQLVIVFWPVVGALYFTKSSKNSAWAGMAVSTAVWFSYVFAASCGIQLEPATVQTDGYIAALMQSDGFDQALTCGSVWGFVAGVAAFFFAYLGERIPHWKLDAPEEEEED